MLAWLAIRVLDVLERIKPIRFIRFFTARIGHCASDVDLFLRRLELKPTKAKLIYVSIKEEPVANEALLDIWRAKFRVIRGGVLGWLFERIFPHLKGTKYLIQLCPSGQEYRAWHVPSVVKKPDRIVEVPYILFHARDNAYSRAALAHNDYRNCSIENCLPAVEEVTQRGFFAVRAGRDVERPLDTRNPRVFDYPLHHKEEHDLKLAAHCYFYLGPNNGTSALPLLYDRPAAYTNSVPFWILNWGKRALFIPKLARDKGSNRLLTFPELQKIGAFDHRARHGVHSNWYEDSGLELVENSPEDIADLCRDMFDLLETRPGQTRLQAEYKERFFSGQVEREWAPNIGPTFIRKHQELL